MLDLCTGSGALAVAIAAHHADARVTATDICADALAVAQGNARRCGVSIEFLQGDMFEPVKGRRFDLIVCNPPYLSAADMRALQLEVRHEPALALYGGHDGLDFYRRIASALPGHLNPGAVAMLEVGAGQAADAKALLAASMPHGLITARKDLAGIERVLSVQI